MQPDFFDNASRIVRDDLIANIEQSDKIAIASSVFSMYAYQELKDQLAELEKEK